MKERVERGSVLVAVVAVLGVVAAVAYLMTRQSAVYGQIAGAAHQADEARYVAEAGLHHAHWVAQESGCSGYALPATPFGNHSYSATFTPTGGSPVWITASGVLANGVTHQIGRRFEILDSVSSLPIQPDPAEGKDAYVNAQQKNRNHGISTTLGIDSGGAHDYYALLEFPLGTLPANVQIRSARLELFLESFGSTNTNARFTAYRMLESWVEGTGDGTMTDDGATHDTSDGTSSWSWPANYDVSNPVAQTRVDPSFSGWHSWDLTALVAGWHAGAFPNQGLVLIGNNQVRDAFFSSSDAPVVTNRPRLVVDYACACGGADSSTTVELKPGIAGRDSYVDDGAPLTNHGSATEIRLSNKINSQKNGLLRFDLSIVPADALVTTAELELDLQGIGSGGVASVDLHRLTQGWSEDGVNWSQASAGVPWSTPGGDYDPTVVASASVDATLPGPVQWDVTSLVGDWISGTFPNHGLLLRGSPDSNHIDFTTGDDADANHHPKLTVTYICSCGECADAPGCDARYAADLKLGHFSTTAYGESRINGLAYLPEGETFLGVAAPAGGAWLSVGWTRGLYMTDLAGDLLASCTLDLSSHPSTNPNPAGLTLVQQGTWAGHLALTAMESDDFVAFVDLDCNEVASFPTLPFGSYTPSGIAFIGTTASGLYEAHLAVADYFNDAIYVVDQAGALKASVDLSAWAGAIHGVAHLPGTDELLLADETGGAVHVIDFVNYNGAPLVTYDSTPFGTSALRAAAIDPSTCDHVLGDENVDQVLWLNRDETPGNTDTFLAIADNRIEEAETLNRGGENNLRVGVDNQDRSEFALARFDVSSLPPGATLSSAKLRLFAFNRSGNKDFDMSAHRITETWTEMGSNWFTSDGSSPWTGGPGGSYDATALDSVAAGGTGWYEWDVTPLVQEWVDGVSPNQGLQLIHTPVAKRNDLQFDSREGGNPPQLVVVWEP